MAGKKAVFGIYATRSDAEEAVDSLTKSGFAISDVSVLVPEDRCGEMIRSFARVEEGHGSIAFDTVRQHKDGRAVDVSLSISPIRTPAGDIAGFSATARDIGQRLRAALHIQRIHRSERRGGRQHDDSVRDRRPGGRLDPRRGQPFEPIGFREDGDGRKDQRCRLRRGEACGEAAPIGDAGSERSPNISSKEKDLSVTGPARRQDRPLDEAQPQNHGIAFRPPRDVRRLRQGDRTGKKDQNRRFGHRALGIRMGDALLHLSDNC